MTWDERTEPVPCVSFCGMWVGTPTQSLSHVEHRSLLFPQVRALQWFLVHPVSPRWSTRIAKNRLRASGLGQKGQLTMSLDDGEVAAVDRGDLIDTEPLRTRDH